MLQYLMKCGMIPIQKQRKVNEIEKIKLEDGCNGEI